jgi:Fic family protein
MKTLHDFIVESNMIEGIHEQVRPEELEAYDIFLALHKLDVADVANLVNIIEPGARLRDNMSISNVQVGNHIPPRSGPELREQLQWLLNQAAMIVDEVEAWRLHCEYETLHPFTDGNGRSGRALWLWSMGGDAPRGFLHEFYYQTLGAYR